MAEDPWWTRLCADTLATASSALPDGEANRALADGVRLDTDQAIDYAMSDQWPLGPGRPGLTARQDQVAELVADGLTNAQIAGRLRVSPQAVAGRLERIRAKLDLPTRAHVIAWVTRQRLERH